MHEAESPPPSIPLLRGSEEQLSRLRKQLGNVFDEISLVHDVVAVCSELCHKASGDFSPELEHVMRRSVCNSLHNQMRHLTKIIERFGGTTTLSEEGVSHAVT
jgi:hypothetical protein